MLDVVLSIHERPRSACNLVVVLAHELLPELLEPSGVSSTSRSSVVRSSPWALTAMPPMTA